MLKTTWIPSPLHSITMPRTRKIQVKIKWKLVFKRETWEDKVYCASGLIKLKRMPQFHCNGHYTAIVAIPIPSPLILTSTATFSTRKIRWKLVSHKERKICCANKLKQMPQFH